MTHTGGVIVQVDDQGRLILPAGLASTLQPGQAFVLPWPLEAFTQERSFLRVIGTMPPLPGGSVAFQREMRGHDDEEDSAILE